MNYSRPSVDRPSSPRIDSTGERRKVGPRPASSAWPVARLELTSRQRKVGSIGRVAPAFDRRVDLTCNERLHPLPFGLPNRQCLYGCSAFLWPIQVTSSGFRSSGCLFDFVYLHPALEARSVAGGNLWPGLWPIDKQQATGGQGARRGQHFVNLCKENVKKCVRSETSPGALQPEAPGPP